MTRNVFLPGAGGSGSFWAPVASRLQASDEAMLVAWPGFGDVPPAPEVQRLSDLADYVLQRVAGPFNLIAQSMGGVVASLIALREPRRVRRLVLCGTSGGMNLDAFEKDDWRAAYLAEMPASTPSWFVEDATDITDRLPSLGMPTLLVWGADDRIAPPAAGRALAALLPDARFVSIPGAGHDVALQKPDEVADLIRAFLTATAEAPPSGSSTATAAEGHC